MLETDATVLLENTAGGENAVARRFDALARLWEAIGGAEAGIDLGFCFDTCHAHAAGEDLGDAVERALAITGQIDLLHANDSRDPAGTGADRHERPRRGPDRPRRPAGDDRAGAAAGAAVIVETPRATEGLRADLEFVRAAIALTRRSTAARALPNDQVRGASAPVFRSSVSGPGSRLALGAGVGEGEREVALAAR